MKTITAILCALLLPLVFCSGIIINSYLFTTGADPAFRATVYNGSTGFTLPLVSGASYDFVVDWGDGGGTDHITAWNQTETTHTYSDNAHYQIAITGVMQRWYFNNSGSKAKLYSVDSWGNVAWSSMANAFYGCSNCVSFPTGGNFSGVTNFNGAWSGCTSLTSFPLIDTSHGTTFDNTWYNCQSMTSFPLIDTSSATHMSQTWRQCYALTSFPLIDTSHCTYFLFAWASCTSLTSFPALDMSAANEIEYTWYNCTGLTTFGAITLAAANIYMGNAWNACSSLTSLPAINFNTAISFTSTFSGMPALATFAGTNIKYNVSFASCNMDATALNTLFTNLATVTSKTITITGNPGAGTCTQSIATSKGWTVTN